MATLWALSLVVVGAVSSGAQTTRRPGAGLGDVPIVTAAPTVVFGDDVGFRIERTVEGLPVGKVVIRLNGRWVDTTTTVSTR